MIIIVSRNSHNTILLCYNICSITREMYTEINKYIRAHNLQDPQNGRKINPDSAVASLLNIKKGEELYRYIHFIQQY